MWIRNLEARLDDPRELNKIRHNGITVGQVLKIYQEEFSTIKQAGRSENPDLKRLKDTDIAELNAIELTNADLITHLISRLEVDGVKPQTAKNDDQAKTGDVHQLTSPGGEKLIYHNYYF